MVPLVYGFYNFAKSQNSFNDSGTGIPPGIKVNGS